jgi:Rrf2 family protein
MGITTIMISQTAVYALRATLHLAEHGEAAPLRVGELARVTGAPGNYLSKILGMLARDGILESTRGPAGGFRLAVDPSQLCLARVVGLFDADPQGRGCLLGRVRCSDVDPCGVHDRWRKVVGCREDFFRDTTMDDVLRGASACGSGGSVTVDPES